MTTVLFNKKMITPSKIICIGRNYVEHIAELGNEIPDEMVAFNKPSTAISKALHSEHIETLHYEAELCFIVNDGNLSGVAVGLDLTKRELQGKLKSKGLPWERAKSFDGSAVFSEFVEVPKSLKDLSIELWINNKLIQSGGVELMMYKPDDILSNLRSYTTLLNGDIVMTGTPKGVGIVNKGDCFIGKVFSQGRLIVEKQWQAI